jgi:hypothetical protein
LSSSTISSERSLGIAAATRSAMAIYVSIRGLPPHGSTGADNPGNGDNSPIKFGYILE